MGVGSGCLLGVWSVSAGVSGASGRGLLLLGLNPRKLTVFSAAFSKALAELLRGDFMLLAFLFGLFVGELSADSVSE